MEKDFTDLMNCAQAQYPEAFSPLEDGGFVLAFEGLSIAFVPIPVEPEMLYVRARVLNISSVGRQRRFTHADFLKRALSAYTAPRAVIWAVFTAKIYQKFITKVLYQCLFSADIKARYNTETGDI